MNVFGFKTSNLKKTQFFGEKGGCNKTVFFLSTCVLQNVKSYRFFAPLFAQFWLMFKNTKKFHHIF